jgi:Tol biopolymer transport system component
LTVSAGNGLYRLDHARISAAGGLAGSRGLVLGSQVGGSPIRVALTGRWPNRAIRGEFTLTDSHSPRVGSAPVFLADPANNVVAADTKVTTRRLLRVRFLAEDRHEPLQIIQAGTTNQFMGTTESDGISRSALVLLGPGLNQLTMRNMHVLLQRQILVLGPDSDGDGLSFADETDLGTDPNVADSDHDGLNDGAEILAGSNPLNPDTDGDGLSDGQEMAAGTSSLVPDSDGDGIGDGVEFVLGSNPASALSTPSTTPQNILFADSSGANGDFLTIIDPNTGAFGLLGQPNGGQPFGLAFDTIPVLFVARGSNLASHQPLPNITTPVGVIGAPGGNPINVQSLTYQPTNDTLYGIEEGPLGRTGQLVAIDPSSGTGTRIGAAGPNPVNCLLVLADGRLLAAVKATASSDRLVRLNPQTGAVAQDIGLIGFTPIVGLGLGTNGVIHAAQRISSTESRLLTVNLATGQGTPTVNVHRGISGLAMFSFRKVPALVSINRFDAASGSGSSDGAVFLSTDGRYVAFTSQASDLVPLADTNAAPDAFLRDLQTGTTELVSVNRFGTAAASSPSFSGSYSSAISADGRYVAFLSWAFDLVGNDFNGLPDLFRRDRLTGTTRLVSVNLSGDPAAAASSGLGVAMSADGRYLAFVTDASGVAVGDTNPGNDVFLRDMVANTTQLVSRSGGLALPGDSRNPIISANGNVVAFWYRTTNQNSRQVLALDVPNNTLTVLTRDRSGAVRFGSAPTDISADGRYIVYASAESELVSQTDTNNTSDVFRYDLLNQTNVLVSVNLAGTATGNGESYQPSISADGRYVTFTSKATNLASVTDTNGAYDIFVRDMVAGTTALVSINSSGTATAYYSRLGLLGDSFNPVISGDGLRVMFLSYATNVVALPPGMNQRSQDVYVRDLPSGKTTVLSANYLGTALGASVSGQGGTHSISSNGLVVAFTSLATNLARITDTNQQPDVFFRLITP